MIGLLPAFGGVVLIYVFCKTVWDSRLESYGYGTLFGVGTVLVTLIEAVTPGIDAGMPVVNTLWAAVTSQIRTSNRRPSLPPGCERAKS